MANTLEYIFSLQDKMSAKIGNITVTSERMLGRFAELERRTQSVSRTFSETGRTMGALREKIALLQAEREWIPAENIEGIRAYNREIRALTREINQLEALNGGKFKKWSKEAFAALPGANLISNPLVAGGAVLGFAGKSAMNFDEGMAKVNITAQLDEKGLSDLSNRLKQLAKDNHTEIEVAPAGLEKIISQVGDADLSMQILDASLKGSKAGFTDLDTVSGALAQSLSVIGKENTNAKEVLDTFFAAKRVGAGEFADFARYMPGLIAGASNMGINFKEVAGTFAYMTGKGQSAERAAVLMENAFSVLGKSDIRGKMEKAGIKVFDEQGKMRGMVDIFTDLKGVLEGMTDEQKSSILEKFGLVDKEAKNAFALMTSDLGKLQEAMDATGNATGETDKALEFSNNSIQKATELWNDFKNMGTAVGTIILPVINVGLDVLSVVVNGLRIILESVVEVFTWWGDKLQENDPLVWALTAAITALSTVLLVNYIRSNATIIALKAMYLWDGIVAGATKLWTAAQWLLNGAFLACPLTWIVVGIGVLVAAVVYCWNEFEGFRMVVLGCWEVIKEFGRTLVDAIVTPFKQVLSGIGNVGSALVSLVKGDFGAAKEAATQGIKDIASGASKMSPISVGIQVAKNGNFADAWEKGKQKGADPQHNAPAKKVPATMIPGTQLPALVDNSPEARFGTPDFFGGKSKPVVSDNPVSTNQTATTGVTNSYKKISGALDEGKKKTGPGSGGGKTSKTLNLNDNSTVQNLKSSAEYTAVTQKLTPKKVDLTPVDTTLLADASNKITDARQRFTGGNKKPDEAGQEYAPEKSEKSDFLKDIMLNVRKIAAIGAIPLAVNLASPAQAEAKVPNVPAPEVSVVSSPNIATPALPAISMPELPPVAVPDIVLPDIAVPEFKAPLLPTIELPEMANVAMPVSDAYQVESSEKTTEREYFSSEKTTEKDNSKTTYIDRFCDQLVIHVQNTDGKGQDIIQQEVINALKKVFEV